MAKKKFKTDENGNCYQIINGNKIYFTPMPMVEPFILSDDNKNDKEIIEELIKEDINDAIHSLEKEKNDKF